MSPKVTNSSKALITALLFASAAIGGSITIIFCINTHTVVRQKQLSAQEQLRAEDLLKKRQAAQEKTRREQEEKRIAEQQIIKQNKEANDRRRQSEIEAKNNAIKDKAASIRKLWNSTPYTDVLYRQFYRATQRLRDYYFVKDYTIQDVTSDGARIVDKYGRRPDCFVVGLDGFTGDRYSGLLVFDSSYEYTTVLGNNRVIRSLRKPTDEEIIYFDEQRKK